MPKQRSRETQREIVAVARRHFAQLGFHKVTMHDIAREVGMGKATLYYYVPTKQDLFRNVVLHEQEGFLGELSKIAARSVSATRMVQDYVERRYRFMNRLLHLNILDVAGSEQMRPMMRKLFDEFVSREITAVALILDSGVRRGEFRLDATGKVAETFVHCIQGLRLRFVRGAVNPTVDIRDYRKLKPELYFFTALFLRGLRNTRG
jgi:TetR/AcrR family transcriptional regulator